MRILPGRRGTRSRQPSRHRHVLARIVCGVLWHLGALGWAKGMIFLETTENYDYIIYFKNLKQIGTENGDIITISKKREHDDFGEPKNGPTRHHECFICTPSSFRSFQSPACEDPLASVALDVPQPRGTVAAASGHTPTSSARSGSALSCYKVGPPVVGFPLVI